MRDLPLNGKKLYLKEIENELFITNTTFFKTFIMIFIWFLHLLNITNSRNYIFCDNMNIGYINTKRRWMLTFFVISGYSQINILSCRTEKMLSMLNFQIEYSKIEWFCYLLLNFTSITELHIKKINLKIYSEI